MSTGTSADTRTRVAVVGGGANCEHDVSLASAASVAAALDPATYDVVGLTIDPHGTWLDGGGRPVGLTGAACLLRRCEVMIPVVHGPHGEDGTLAALGDLAGLPVVGSGVRAGALAMDKWTTKLVANAVGVATAPGVLITPRTRQGHTWTHPVVVKPVAAGSSRGVALVDDPALFEAALDAAFTFDDRVLVEDIVVGREIDVAVLGRRDGSHLVAPTLEIVTATPGGIFSYEEKYGGAAEFRIPAALDVADTKALEQAAVVVYDALGCAGVARVDFFWTQDGPVLNEVNTMPGFTEQSQVPKMFAAVGLTYPALLDLLVRDTLAAAGG